MFVDVSCKKIKILTQISILSIYNKALEKYCLFFDTIILDSRFLLFLSLHCYIWHPHGPSVDYCEVCSIFQEIFVDEISLLIKTKSATYGIDNRY